MRIIPSIMAVLLVICIVFSGFALPAMDTDIFSSSESGISGTYVSFSLNDDLRDLPLYLAGPNMSGEAIVLSFASIGTPLFSSIAFSTIGNVTLEQMGNSFILDGTGGQLEIHDNPSSTLIFNAHTEGRLDLTANENISLKIENNTVLLDRHGTIGRLFLSSGGVNISGRTITLSLQNNSQMVLRTLPYLEYTGDESAIMSSVLSGKITGELYISREGDLVKDDYSAYGSMAAQTSMVSAEKIGVAITGNEGGNIILIHVPKGMMAGPTTVKIDGKEPAAAPSLSQMLSYSGSPNAYFIMQSGNYSSVLVYLSEPGGHTVSIRESATSSLSVGDYLTMSIGASIVALATLLLYRKN